MKLIKLLIILICSVFVVSGNDFKLEKVEFFDRTRSRKIRVALYLPENAKQTKKMPLVIFSHGYGQNSPDSYLAYSYLTENLAKNGYFVASIQHELPTDELIPTSGIPQVVRRPFWERGSDNILFTINELKQKYPKLDYKNLTIMGHSNGGDISVLFVEKHPEFVKKLITLDQRRMAFPRIKKPKIYSIRSSDQPADEGVLPTLNEQKKIDITIIKLANTIHNDMDDNANTEQRKEINDLIIKFLAEK